MTEKTKYMTKLSEDRTKGLKDVKYFFVRQDFMTPEEIYAALNEFQAAAENAQPHDGWEDASTS